MANQKINRKLLYNPKIVADRISDLRKGDGSNGITLDQLSTGIKKKTEVKISGMQLGKYENADLKQRMNINNLLALADYYDVSLDYLVGRSDTPSNDVTDKHISKKIGIRGKALKLLETIHRGGKSINWSDDFNPIIIGNTIISSKLINFIFENEKFWSGFDGLLARYYSAMKEPKRVHPSEVDEIMATKTSLILLFNDLIDDIYAFISKSTPKHRRLFEIDKKKSNKKLQK